MSKILGAFALALALALVLAVPGPASATVFTYNAVLDRPNESPPVDSPGIGTARVVYDDVARTLLVDVEFSGLLWPVTVAHIHCCVAVPQEGNIGVATTTPTFPGFPAGVTEGSYLQVFDLTDAASWNPAFVTNNGGTTDSAELALAAGLANRSAYFNIHTTQFPAGEIRGFLVPEPSTALLLGAGIALLARRRRT